MTPDELAEALDGLFAYDTGCDSGIHDELLRERAKVALRSLTEAELALMTREMFLTDERIRQRYGLEDVAHFIRWLDERMDYSV